MTFSAVRSEDPRDYYAPWQVWIDGAPFVTGLELENEAIEIRNLLSHATPKVASKKKPRFVPRQIDGFKLISTRRLLNEQKGQALVEAAFALGILLMLLLGGLDLFFALTANGDVHSLANSGAQCVVTPNCGNAVAFVQNAAAGLSLNASQLTVTQNGNTITVAYAYQPIGPVFPSVNLAATATAP
jgi:hypothetical protein